MEPREHYILDMEIKRERLLIRLNDGKEITEEISEGEGTMAYGTTRPLNAFVDICLNKKCRKPW